MAVMNVQAVGWLALLIVTLAAEAVTLGLTTIWFSAGALAALILSLVGVGWQIQVAVFFVVSAVLLISMRPIAAKWLNKGKVSTNADSLIGRTAIVTEPVDNLSGTGGVQVRGQYWTARTASDEIKIAANSRVVIEKISGVKLIVKEETEWKES